MITLHCSVKQTNSETCPPRFDSANTERIWSACKLIKIRANHQGAIKSRCLTNLRTTLSQQRCSKIKELQPQHQVMIPIILRSVFTRAKKKTWWIRQDRTISTHRQQEYKMLPQHHSRKWRAVTSKRVQSKFRCTLWHQIEYLNVITNLATRTIFIPTITSHKNLS